MERSKNIFERIKSYPVPPIISLPDLKKIDLLAGLELSPRKSTRYALNLLSFVSGFSRFIKNAAKDRVAA